MGKLLRNPGTGEHDFLANLFPDTNVQDNRVLIVEGLLFGPDDFQYSQAGYVSGDLADTQPWLAREHLLKVVAIVAYGPDGARPVGVLVQKLPSLADQLLTIPEL